MHKPARIETAISVYRAALTPAKDDAPPEAGKRKRVRGLAYSGGLVPKHAWLGDNAIDVSTLTTKGRVNLLAGHDHAQLVGSATVEIKDHQVWIEGEISQATQSGRELSATLDEGLITWELSVGVAGQLNYFTPAADVEVNGQAMTLDSLMTHARLLEVSFVAVGADPNTHVEQLTAKYGAGQCATPTPTQPTHPTPGDDPMKLEEALAKVSELQGQLSAVTESNKTLMAEMSAIKADARKADVTAMFKAAFNRAPTDVEIATYSTFNAEQFAAVRQTFGAVVAPNPQLLTEIATHGTEEASATGTGAAAVAANANAWLASLKTKYGAHSQTA
jgi:hypothetical protein